MPVNGPTKYTTHQLYNVLVTWDRKNEGGRQTDREKKEGGREREGERETDRERDRVLSIESCKGIALTDSREGGINRRKIQPREREREGERERASERERERESILSIESCKGIGLADTR